jgi:hypothetical protein
MADQPVTLAIFAQFYREVFLPDFQRIVDEAFAEPCERGRRAFVRFLFGSLDSLEAMYGFVQDDVRRLERWLDELHVLIERGESCGVPRLLENSSYKHEDALAARIRLRGYLADLGESIERTVERPAKDTLQTQSMDLRRRVEDLAPPLDIAGRRLSRYAQRVAAGPPAVEPRTSGGTEER